MTLRTLKTHQKNIANLLRDPNFKNRHGYKIIKTLYWKIRIWYIIFVTKSQLYSTVGQYNDIMLFPLCTTSIANTRQCSELLLRIRFQRSLEFRISNNADSDKVSHPYVLHYFVLAFGYGNRLGTYRSAYED